MTLRYSVAVGVVMILGGCGATPPAPPNMPPPIPRSELKAPNPARYASIIEMDGLPKVSSGSVGHGQSLITIPFRFRHTAILTEDVRGYSVTVGGSRLSAGATGYYAGEFGSSYGYTQSDVQQDMWCFFRETDDDEGDAKPLCLLRGPTGLAAIAPNRGGPYLWTSFSPATGTFDFVYTPIFERRQVDLPVKFESVYRFEEWRDEGAMLGHYVNGEKVTTRLAAASEGSDATIDTIAGQLKIRRSGAGNLEAMAELVPYEER